MANLNVLMPDELQAFVETRVNTGEYQKNPRSHAGDWNCILDKAGQVKRVEVLPHKTIS